MRTTAHASRTRVRRELGIRIEIIEGLAEARYGFAGAVRGLEVSNGLLFDLGGGSLQITRFARRRLVKAVSLPFGALRLSEKFLDLRSSHAQTAAAPARSCPEPFGQGVAWVALRSATASLAPEGRSAIWPRSIGRRGDIPIGSLHGYELSVDRLAEVVDRLAATREKRRDEIPGLSAERADSIVGGAVAIQTLAEFVRAKHILVSGQGVREGVALGMLKMAVGSPENVKEASLSSLVSRFDGWRPDAAARRRGVAASLQRALQPRAPRHIALAIDRAARVLDIGRSFDVVNRHEHAADILLTTDLNGFSHDELALVSAVVRRAGDRHAEVPPLALLRDALQSGLLDRAAIILALADEIEARCPRGSRIAIRLHDRPQRDAVSAAVAILAREGSRQAFRARLRPTSHRPARHLDKQETRRLGG